ncbi:uncharacterized protein LOC125946962 [Dermacentor silvarum]|uniref:uncharacterized protein LOC125946962 n=1 Tax=Dermacentor silvarum TaxID=543639 RepID=UPI002101B16C|nr:uncharacterized protein LOC125946962 [Dermacentor silvarum]
MQMASIMSEQTAVFCAELLLDAIKQYPVLYDKSLPRYKEVEYKKELWMKIAADLGVTATTCQTKFKNLKDTFTKLKTKIKDKSKSGAGAKDIPSVKWKHFEAMLPIMEKVYEEPIICSNITFEQTRGAECHSEEPATSKDNVEDEFLWNDIFEDDAVDLEKCGSSSSERSGRRAATTDSSEIPPETDTVETEVEEANKRQGQCCCCCTWCVQTMGNALINLSFSTVHQGHRSHVEHQETERRLLNKHQHLWTWQSNV